ncbi:MAG: superoxide dismutase [Taibaiella sp.]|nr:superoxide dismutase [Taibaiella sp.]
MAYTLPELPYAYDALERSIDKETMTIHHTKHHQAYVDNLNKALEGKDAPEDLEELMKNISKYDKAVRNNGGGHYNHSLFWKVLSPNGGGQPTGAFADCIDKCFGSFEEFKKQFEEKAKTQFGSGWAWLVCDGNEHCQVTSTPNQDNPLMDIAEVKGIPIFGVDVWEHAYYLKYQNKRPDYLAAIWDVVNWDEVAKNWAAANTK